MTVRYPKYSFVQADGAMSPDYTYQPYLRPPNAPPIYATNVPCCTNPSYCLPISSVNNLRFHVFFDDMYDEISGYSTVTNVLCYAIPVATDVMSPPTTIDIYGGMLFGNHYTPIVPTATSPNLSVNFDRPYINGVVPTLDSLHIAVGDCFKLMLVYWPYSSSSGYIGSSPIFAGFTTCFQRVPAGNLCYTSLLTYWNNPYDDAFDFDYIDGVGYANMVELPMYLRDPKMENDQKVYTKSDGSLVKLYERKEETYTLETDLMPYAWHKSLDIALSHENIYITSPNATTFDPVNTANRFVKKENYEIEYQKAPLSSLGKGSCKLSNANPIHLINNNCG